jgi:hypothetical protein
VSRLQLVVDHQDTFEMKRLCELVEVERSPFYTWEAAAPARAARAAADAELTESITAVHAEDKTCGAPRITAALSDGAAWANGAATSGRRGDARPRHRRLPTPMPGPREPSGQKVSDLLGRGFTAAAPNQRYVGDITYLPIADGANLVPGHRDRLLQPSSRGLAWHASSPTRAPATGCHTP